MLMQSRTRKQRVSKQTSIPAPTGGLNAKDPLAEMAPNEAVVMDDYFPLPSSVKNRNGSVNHATGIAGTVETICVYNNGANRQMFAIASGSIYEATSAGDEMLRPHVTAGRLPGIPLAAAKCPCHHMWAG